MLPPVLDHAWLRHHRGEVVLADVRWYLDGRSGRAAYADGHLPGAVFVDLEECLAGPGGPQVGRHPLPEPTVFADAMAGLGIGEQDTVIAYDDAGGTVAARLVWMLRATGHAAALLDGGITAYPGELEQSTPVRKPAVFTPRPWPTDQLADINAAADQANTVLDARAPERYRGEEEPIDARAGHIPGARSLPCRGNLAADGRFLPVDELRQRFAEAGVGEGASVVSYCGSGVTACHNLLALELTGLARGRLYPGSWSQYSHTSSRPVATGSSA